LKGEGFEMKILLVNPPQNKVYGKMNAPDYPSLGLAYIGAVIEKAKYSVSIIDMDADDISFNEFLKIIEDFDVIGFTCTTPTFDAAAKLCEVVKKKTSAITVLGGIHPTIAPEQCMKNKFIDFIIKGEGEVTILELLEAIKGDKDYSKVKGISYWDKGKVVHNTPRELIQDLDSLPFPARHLFNHQKYTYPDSMKSPVMPVMTSRGCPHGCTYCCTKLIFSRKVRFRSAKNIVDEIDYLIKRYKVKEIHFWDDNFTLKKDRVLEIFKEIKRRGIKLNFAFPNGLRVDQVDEDILRWLKDMGTYSIAFGVESGNQQILNNVKKGTNLKQIKKAYAIAKRLGFETWGFFMLGLPGDDNKTIRETINFAKNLNPDIAKFHILKPFPGTEAFDELKERGLITEFDYSLYGIHTRPVHRLETLSEDDLLEWSKKAYKEFYLRPSKIIEQMWRIKSVERLKLNLKTGLSLLNSMR